MQLLECKKLGQGILVDDEDYEIMRDKRIGWNGRRGAYYCVDRKKVYVHRQVYANMLLPEEHHLLNDYNVGFRDGDPSNCLRNNLFLWRADLKTKQSRMLAKKEALCRTRELEYELHLQDRKVL